MRPDTPSNDKEPVNTRRTISDEHRAKIAAGNRRRWAKIAPERRKEMTAALCVAARKKRQLKGALRGPSAAAIPSWVDPDFDELEG